MDTKNRSSNSGLEEALIGLGRFFVKGHMSDDFRSITKEGGRDGDEFYRDRWSHDKVVRSTHGVNCTGSCSWKVYVKDGIITWETQQTDYPSVGPDSPEYEPRGCPRGAAFSWYTYSPTRIRFPYIRGVLLEMYREAKLRLHDPVLAWADVVDNPVSRSKYQQARGKGGLVRAQWSEISEIIAAAHVHTIKKYGPDRVFGFSPIPAMSMASHAAGARFVSLMGGAMLSFYDWYADLPVASPQVFGDQTDVPESADWFNASYLIMWGSNVPVTRTPDAHFMAEARYRGQKVVAISPDYADNTKFADEWVAPHPGTDGALGMAMGHVILKEFFVEKQTPRFNSYVKKYTDLPYLVALRQKNGEWIPDKFIVASDLGDTSEGAKFKPVLLDSSDGKTFIPNGSLGHRFNDESMGKWNLDLEGVDPVLSIYEQSESKIESILLPRFDMGQDNSEGGGSLKRSVPTIVVAGKVVTTVFDLMLAQYGVSRPGLIGDWPANYEDPSPYTPAWQEEITNVPAAQAIRIAREFAQNADESEGRSMILLGAGTNHWFHSDTMYRTFLALVTLTGCQGVNGGGWAHYVGQEKCRPVTGWAQLAFGSDWSRPARQMIGTAFWYVSTDQWRYDGLKSELLSSELGENRFKDMTGIDVLAKSARMGWMPSYPSFNRNTLELTDEARTLGIEPAQHVVNQLKNGQLQFAIDDPDAPENWPRILTVWRANILGSSSKGNEYFLKHLLGTNNSVRASQNSENNRPRDVKWHEEAPQGKLDLLVSIDFRMTSTGLFGDILLPAATWYEKHDLSSTDMHPFIHAFTPAINPPWETKSDYDIFQMLARQVSHIAKGHLAEREDIVAVPLLHDTPDAMSNPSGIVADWRRGEVEPIPGVTMPKLVVIKRNYTQIGEKMSALGPLVDQLGTMTKGVPVSVLPEVEHLKHINGVVSHGVAQGRPSLATAINACETILSLSGTTNGRVAVAGFRALEKRTGQKLTDLALDNEGKRITFADTQARPVPVITSPEWSGSEHGGRRYTAFAINVERNKPWHTLTGRQHFFIDHDWMSELGEQMPIFRPPLNMYRLFGEQSDAPEKEVTVRYLTPHSKWSIHSEYQDNLFMLSLSRGGQEIWMSVEDAEQIGVKDNEWIEAYNRNGVVVARACVSHRMPKGTVFMYHAKDRVVDVPIAEKSGNRGGIHNSLTRLMLKPTHLIGGYAQLTFAFNYLGPTGNQRDEVTVIRRRSQEVTY